MAIERITVLERIPEDLELRRSWNDLILCGDRPEVFYTYEWAIAIQRAYGSSLSPLLFLAYEADSLIGIVALATRANGEVVFLAADTGDYCDFLSRPEIRSSFIDMVLDELKKRNVQKIVLTNLPADSPSAKAISEVSWKHHFHFHRRTAYRCARVELGRGDQRIEVKKTVIGKKRLRRNLREMEKIGKVVIQHDTSWEKVEPLLPAFMRTHVVRFLEAGKISSIVHSERRAFLAELSRELSNSGWVVVSRFLVDHNIAASHLGFRFGRSWFWYQPTLNRVFGDYSPGYCLLAKIVEQACDSPDIDVVDLGLGAEGYKDRFTTASRETLYCELNRSYSQHTRTAVRYRVAETLRSLPKIESRVRHAMLHLYNFKSRLQSIGVKKTLAWSVKRLAHAAAGSEDILFFDSPANSRPIPARGMTLVPLDPDLIGDAAIHYGQDTGALHYLMRCAKRLAAENIQGYALLANGIPVHFCWVRDFEGFDMPELNRRLQAPAADAVMVFDCYTPASVRGYGYFSQAISLTAATLQRTAKSPWIFVASTDHSSVRGIQKSAFQYKFTLGRRRIAFFSQRNDSIPEDQTSNAAASVTAA